MKAWYKIHDKPRGRWRPLLEFGISLSEEEDEEIKNLNMENEVEVCMVFTSSNINPSDCKRHIALPFVEKLYENRYKIHCGNSNKEGEIDKYGHSVCPDCPYSSMLKKDRDRYLFSFHFRNSPVSFRLPWRPGAKPDYSDFIQPLKEFLSKILVELERRILEVRESAPSDEWGVYEEVSLPPVAERVKSHVHAVVTDMAKYIKKKKQDQGFEPETESKLLCRTKAVKRLCQAYEELLDAEKDGAKEACNILTLQAKKLLEM